ncbi:MAG: DUF2306 domain-containing protein, partial [Pseudohongiella sp.]|nr:DUF2306 domain-containing protein [Pseudohongiella sp.]
MINVPRNGVLPAPMLQVIGLIGWAFIVYLVYDALNDVVTRAGFIRMSLSGDLHPQAAAHPFNARYVEMPMLTLAHVIPGFLFMLLGPLQFISSLRKRFPKVHRVSGYVYLLSAVLVALGAAYIGFVLPIWGWTLNQWVSLLSSVLMLYFLYRAFGYIRVRDIRLHREFMIRGFAVGLSISTLRLFLDWG